MKKSLKSRTNSLTPNDRLLKTLKNPLLLIVFFVINIVCPDLTSETRTVKKIFVDTTKELANVERELCGRA
jgi:hypothetical protein